MTVTGGTPSKSNEGFYGDFIPLVKPPELCDGELDSAEDGLSEAGGAVARTAPPNSILVSCIGNLGKIGLNTIPVAFNQQINAIFPDEGKALPLFMFYQVLSCSFRDQLESLASGTTVPIVNKSKFNSIEVVLPPIPEQQRIVAILDEAFAGIATARAAAEQNRQNARALFESHLQSVFSQRGEGWVETTIADVCIIGDGNHSSNYPRKEELVESGVPFIRATNMIRGRISNNDMRFLSLEKHAQLKKGHLKTGDILITNRGEIGKTAMVDEMYDNSNLNSQIAWLRCRDDMDNRFLFHALNSPAIQAHFQSAKNGAALQQFTIRQLKELIVPRPPKSKQEEIVSNLDELAIETQRLEVLYQSKLEALVELKQSLLYKAFNGEL